MPWFSETSDHITRPRIEQLLDRTIAECRRRLTDKPRRVLLLPPDITRMHSGAGWMTEYLYEKLSGEAEVHLIPTLGQHIPHTPEQNREMFGRIPDEAIHAHDWIKTCVNVGEISADVVRETSGGLADWAMPIQLNTMLMEQPWDWIINIGHVVPHEVLGFANHNKNYFIGLAGKELICTSHMMAASCGIENNLGCLVTPVRECFNRAEEQYLKHLPHTYVQVVLSRNGDGDLVHTGCFVGDDLDTYLEAARLARKRNITLFDEPLKKVVCVMQGNEFFSTWVANKAVYRTRMALADDGELVILAPGLRRFGEQDEVERLIRKYGYRTTPEIVELYKRNRDMQECGHGTAHLIHGSSEGRFKITYAPGHLDREAIEGVGYEYADLSAMLDRYGPETRKQGRHTTDDGEEYYFIPTPSAGLWSTRDKLYNRPGGFGE